MKKRNILNIIIVSIITAYGLGIVYLNSDYFNLLGPCDEKNFFINESVKGIVINCGATTDYATQFLLYNNPILILKGDYSDKCNISWVDPQTLNIKCPPIKDKDIFLNKTSEGNIKINFSRQ